MTRFYDTLAAPAGVPGRRAEILFQAALYCSRSYPLDV